MTTIAKTYVELEKAILPIKGERETRNILNQILEKVTEKHWKSNWKSMDEKLSGEEEEKLWKMADRLKKGEPVQYVTGISWFFGRPFHVTPDVLIPRPETEELCQLILDSVSRRSKVLDVGTGSGAIAITLEKESSHQVKGVDISEKAIELARKNALKLGSDASFEVADILKENSGLSKEHYDVIVSNPPYIHRNEETGPGVRDFEPGLALFVEGEDPLLFYRKIASLGKQVRNRALQLFLEINEFRSDETSLLFEKEGYKNIRVLDDLQGKPRFLTAVG